ncbi:MAG: hypothetical protein ACFFDE_09155 [Promethearchaeota archaeon]
MQGSRNIFTHISLQLKSRVKMLLNTRFPIGFLTMMIVLGALIVNGAISSLNSDITIGSSGKILALGYAASGSAADIQEAVDRVAAAGGGNVYIPAGAFNFVEIGQQWSTIEVPARVNICGAPTDRDANGQVVKWQTTLIMPYEVPTDGPDDCRVWFSVYGNEDPNTQFRFSDIKLIGWRYFDNTSTTQYTGVMINKVLNFRVDHCHFQDMAGSGVFVWSWPLDYRNRGTANGVIDHCIFNNTYGNPGFMTYGARTLGYGVGMRRWACDLWDVNLSNIVGQYTNYTVFIEDNYFSKWRHSVCSNDGFHYVFRHNTVEGCYAIGSIDAHGSYADGTAPYAVGTRAIEVYENIFKNPDTLWNSKPWAINLRGGSGIIFNNTIEGYYGLIQLNNDWGNYVPYAPECAVNQTYIWNNNLGSGMLISYNADSRENADYFLRAPNLEQDGFMYTPYSYPHPLALS